MIRISVQVVSHLLTAGINALPRNELVHRSEPAAKRSQASFKASEKSNSISTNRTILTTSTGRSLLKELLELVTHYCLLNQKNQGSLRWTKTMGIAPPRSTSRPPTSTVLASPTTSPDTMTPCASASPRGPVVYNSPSASPSSQKTVHSDNIKDSYFDTGCKAGDYSMDDGCAKGTGASLLRHLCSLPFCYYNDKYLKAQVRPIIS